LLNPEGTYYKKSLSQKSRTFLLESIRGAAEPMSLRRQMLASKTHKESFKRNSFVKRA
jgi:hypothetical protein